MSNPIRDAKQNTNYIDTYDVDELELTVKSIENYLSRKKPEGYERQILKETVALKSAIDKLREAESKGVMPKDLAKFSSALPAVFKTAFYDLQTNLAYTIRNGARNGRDAKEQKFLTNAITDLTRAISKVLSYTPFIRMDGKWVEPPKATGTNIKSTKGTKVSKPWDYVRKSASGRAMFEPFSKAYENWGYNEGEINKSVKAMQGKSLLDFTSQSKSSDKKIKLSDSEKPHLFKQIPFMDWSFIPKQMFNTMMKLERREKYFANPYNKISKKDENDMGAWQLADPDSYYKYMEENNALTKEEVELLRLTGKDLNHLLGRTYNSMMEEKEAQIKRETVLSELYNPLHGINKSKARFWQIEDKAEGLLGGDTLQKMGKTFKGVPLLGKLTQGGSNLANIFSMGTKAGAGAGKALGMSGGALSALTKGTGWIGLIIAVVVKAIKEVVSFTRKVWKFLSENSPVLQAINSLLHLFWNMFFMPIGNAIGVLLLPLMDYLIDWVVNWNKLWSNGEFNWTSVLYAVVDFFFSTFPKVMDVLMDAVAEALSTFFGLDKQQLKEEMAGIGTIIKGLGAYAGMFLIEFTTLTTMGVKALNFLAKITPIWTLLRLIGKIFGADSSESVDTYSLNEKGELIKETETAESISSDTQSIFAKMFSLSDLISKLEDLSPLNAIVSNTGTIGTWLNTIMDKLGISSESREGVLWTAITGGVGYFLSQVTPLAMASGGIVNSATPAIVGEAGPEAVIPLSQFSEVVGGSYGNITVYVTGDVYGVSDLDTRITKAINKASNMSRYR